MKTQLNKRIQGLINSIRVRGCSIAIGDRYYNLYKKIRSLIYGSWEWAIKQMDQGHTVIRDDITKYKMAIVEIDRFDLEGKNNWKGKTMLHKSYYLPGNSHLNYEVTNYIPARWEGFHPVEYKKDFFEDDIRSFKWLIFNDKKAG